MIGYVWPEPRSSAAGVRDRALLEIFRAAGHQVVFASTSRRNEHAELLIKEGVEIAEIAANDPTFDETVAAIAPDIVIFDRFVYEEQFGWRVRAACPNALRVLDTQDLHFVRKAREAALRSGQTPEQAFSAWDTPVPSEECLRELAAIHRSDLVWVCSQAEKDLLSRRLEVPADKLGVAGFFHAAPPVPGPEFEAREGFVMIGNFRHAPNADAVRWLHGDIWSRLRARLPQAQVRIYGAYPPREMMALTNPAQGFHVEGPAAGEAADTLARFRVNLAPLRFGAGIKGKIAEGWRVGTPAVTTPIGAEGMTAPERPFGGEVEWSADRLAEMAVGLHQSPTRWRQAHERGLALVLALYARAPGAAAILGQLDHAVRTRESRRRDLTTSLLWYHGLRSTEYFSRWIEAKNRPPI